MTSQRQDPSDFLKQIIGRPVVVKLNSGVDYRGVLGSLDGYMNIVLEQTEEYVNGQLKNKYGDAFLRGNNEIEYLKMPGMPTDPILKNIKIKTGVVTRCTKEKKSYEKEVEKMEEKIAKMKADGEDEYKIMKQNDCKAETQSMIPDSKNRLKKACDDLDMLLKQQTTYEGEELYKEAQKALLDAEAHKE